MDHQPVAELSEVAQPLTDAPAAAAAETGAATEETWRAAWDQLIALLHDKVGNVHHDMVLRDAGDVAVVLQ